jgi:hypothetical protein
MAERIRTAARRYFDQQLDEIDALSESVYDAVQVDPSSRNAGNQYLTNASKMAYASAAQVKLIAEKFRLSELLADVCIDPAAWTNSNQDQGQDEHESE